MSRKAREVIAIDRQKYVKMLDFFRKNSSFKFILEIFYKWLPAFVFISYGVLLVFTATVQSEKFFRIFIVPLGVFVFVTVLRKIINAKRPYEKFGVPPLFVKKSTGNSMPSRHTACAFIIAMAFLYYRVDLGILYLAVAVLIMLSRVFSGVHFLRDVLVGMGISILCGIVFFFVI